MRNLGLMDLLLRAPPWDTHNSADYKGKTAQLSMTVLKIYENQNS
jgi:hypothetical protein